MDNQLCLRRSKLKPLDHLCESEDPLSKAKSLTLEVMLLTDQVGGTEILTKFKDWILTIQPVELTNLLAQNKTFHLAAENVIPFITSDLRRHIRKKECGYRKKDNDGPAKTTKVNTTAPVEVDSFLFEDLQDALEEQELKSDRICDQCQSSSVTEFSVNYNSYTTDVLINLFGVVLEDLSGKQVCIIGSKVGALALGACLFSNAERIVSYEADQTSLEIQNRAIHKHSFSSHLKVKFVNELLNIPIEEINYMDVVIFDDSVYDDPVVSFINTLRANLQKGTTVVCKNDPATEMKMFTPDNALHYVETETSYLSSQVFKVYKIL